MNGEFISYDDLGAFLFLALLVGVAFGYFVGRLIHQPKRLKVSFTEPIKAETFMRVRDEYERDVLRQIQPKTKTKW